MAFKIGGKHAISFTMVRVTLQITRRHTSQVLLQVNAEDGGDSDYHDTVVGVAVC